MILTPISISEHNAEAKAVWQAYHNGQPIPSPGISGHSHPVLYFQPPSKPRLKGII